VGEIKTVATEHPADAAIVEVVRVAVVAVQPGTIVITLEVEDLAVAIGVRYVQSALCDHCLSNTQDGCILFGICMP